MNQNLSTDVTEAIVNSLSSPEEELRRSAVVALASFSLEKSSAYLLRAMGDASWRVRKEAVEVFLSSSGAERYAGALFDLLRSQDNAGLRNSAAETLARLGTSALPVLEAHAHDSDGDVRKFVIDILGAIADPSSARVLVNALADDDPNVAIAAAENLGAIGRAEDVPALLDALPREDITFRYTVLETLAKIGEPVSFELVAPYLSDTLLKKAVYECLGSVGEADAVPVLVTGLAESAKSVREVAAKALVAIREKKTEAWERAAGDRLLAELAGSPAVEGLLAVLDNGDINLRRAIISIFGLIGDPRAAGAILRSCRNEHLLPDCIPALRSLGTVTIGFFEEEYVRADEGERANILRLCGELQMVDAVALLRKALDDPSPQVREVSVRSVGKIGLVKLIPDVAVLLGDFDQDVRSAALDALALLAALDTSAIGAIASSLAGSDNPDRRRDAAYLCGVLRDGDRLSLLMKDEDDLVRRTAVQGMVRLGDGDAVHLLTMALTDENTGVRIAAASSLGEMGRQESVPPLVLVVADPDPWVRCAALRSLGKIGGEVALAAIERAFDGADGLVSLAALDALRGFDSDRSRELARQATTNNDGDVVKAAIEILAEAGDPWLADHIEEFLGHLHWDVRNTAIRYLAETGGRESLPLLRAALDKETDDLVKSRIVEILERFR